MSRIGMSLALAMFISAFVLPFAFASQDIQMIQAAGQRSKNSAVKLNCKGDKAGGGIQGIVCPYYMANDNLTFQALYLIQKISKIENAIQDGETAQAETALGAFCNQRNGETVNACFTRYKTFQSLALVRIREAIGRNEDTVARLTSGRKNDGKVDGKRHHLDFGMERENYVPEVLTLAQLETEFQEGVKSGRIQGVDLKANKMRQDHGKWAMEMVSPLKSKEHYVFQSEQVEANPGSAGDKRKLTMYRRDNGQTVEDAKVTRFVDQKYREIHAVMRKTSGTDEAELITPANIKKDSITYESVREARAEIIGAVEGAMKKNSGSANTAQTAQLSGSGGARAPAYSDEKVIERPKTDNTHYYIRYDLGKLLSEAQSLK